MGQSRSARSVKSSESLLSPTTQLPDPFALRIQLSSRQRMPCFFREVIVMQRRILLAKDHEQTYLALQQLFQSDANIHVDTVSDGSAALQALTEQNYSIF